MSQALKGYRILDFTHVQSGPTCTQLLAWFGADVIKVERAGEGDATRGQLRDIPGVDSLYFTMLNHNKRSVTIDTKKPQGKQVLESLIRHCDVLVENFAPGALDRMGFTWEHIQTLNPRMIVASVKGFGPGKNEDCKVYENVAQCAGGSASTTGFDDGPPVVTGAHDQGAARDGRVDAVAGRRHRGPRCTHTEGELEPGRRRAARHQAGDQGPHEERPGGSRGHARVGDVSRGRSRGEGVRVDDRQSEGHAQAARRARAPSRRSSRA
jgi:hypothetical protein